MPENQTLVARNSQNTVRLPVPIGFVCVRFLSPNGHPIAGPEYALSGDEKDDWQAGEEKTETGTLLWRDLPIADNYEVSLTLAGRSVKNAVPWLAASEEPHSQHVWDADTLLGAHDDVHGMQVRLRGLGFPCGPVDGVAGAKTNDAVQKFANSRGFGDVEDGQRLGELLAIEFGA